MSKVLLCRPRGGMHDQLCSVADCFTYATNFGRKLIVDSNHDGLMDSFWNYFKPRPGIITFQTQWTYGNLEGLTTFPPQLKGRLKDLSGHLVSGEPYISDRRTGVPLTFDFTKDYPQELIIHEQGRLGHHNPRGSEMWKILCLTQSVRQEVINAIASLPSPWFAIHVRNTDYLTPDHIDVFKSIAMDWARDRDIVICSDSEEVFENAKQTLLFSRIHRLSKTCSKDKEPIHTKFHGDSQRMINIQMLIDLFALALSSETLFLPVTVKIQGKDIKLYSGFSIMANELAKNKDACREILSNEGEN